jgi:hypothetical protein
MAVSSFLLGSMAACGSQVPLATAPPIHGTPPVTDTLLMPPPGGGSQRLGQAAITALVQQVAYGEEVSGPDQVSVLTLEVLTVELLEGSAPVSVGQVTQAWVKGEIPMDQVGQKLTATIRLSGDGTVLWLSDLEWDPGG